MKVIIAIFIIVLVVVFAMAAGSSKSSGEDYKTVTFSSKTGNVKFDSNEPPKNLLKGYLSGDEVLATLAGDQKTPNVPMSYGTTPSSNGVSVSGYLPESLFSYNERGAPKNFIQDPFRVQANGNALLPTYTSVNWGFGTPLMDTTYARGQLFMPPAHLRAPKYNIWRNPRRPFDPQPITLDRIDNDGFYDADF